MIGLLALMIVFLFGHFRLKHFKDDNQSNHLIYSSLEIEAYQAVVTEEPQIKTKSVKAVVQIQRVFASGETEALSGRVNLYLNKETATDLRYGDLLLIKGKPQRMTGPLNPGEFDYRNYLVYNNIFHQHFAQDDFEILGNQPPSAIMNYALTLRGRCRKVLTGLLPDDKVRGVVLALVIGAKDELDVEVQQAYAASGAMHVLAVSGLHVGIVYGLILLLFKQLRLHSGKGRWWLAATSIAVLWIYAFVTGLSPSVLRAVTMFSFIALGKALQRNTNIYNTLAASAFVLLWYNPYLIMSVGFQLSYLAVFGIVYLQPKFYGLLEVKSAFLDKIWAITCVSFAAQLATGPLSMLYFHQFPAYFFLSNLFIIPAALLILVMGLSLLALGWIPFIGTAIGWTLTKFVWLTNELVFMVEGIPGSLIDGINLKTYESWLIYFSIIFALLLFHKKRFKYIVSAILMSFVFGVSQILDRSHYSDKSAVSFFNVSNASVFDFQLGRHAKLVGDTAFINDPNKLRFSIEPKRLTAYQDINVNKDGLNLISSKLHGSDLYAFEGRTYLHVKNDSISQFQSAQKIPIDHIIVSNESVSDLSWLIAIFDVKNLIIDKSNRKYWADRLSSQAETLNLNVHSIYEQGYLEIKTKE